jgi:hypothetical protein
MFTYSTSRLSNIVTFTPTTAKAKRLARTKKFGLEPWQWVGDSFVVEKRYALDLITRLSADGFTVKES